MTNEFIKLRIVKIGLSMIGQSGVVGPKSNNRLLNFFNKLNKNLISDDDIPWCSAFLKGILAEIGLQDVATLSARSWLSVGLKTINPEIGDVVIFWRESPSSWKGHVGIYIAESDNQILVLGGNQGNEVNISKFPKSMLLGYRDISGLKSNLTGLSA